MKKTVRLIIAVILLALSITCLFWGYLPNPHLTLDRTISPAEMQLPTPSSLYSSPEIVS